LLQDSGGENDDGDATIYVPFANVTSILNTSDEKQDQRVDMKQPTSNEQAEERGDEVQEEKEVELQTKDVVEVESSSSSSSVAPPLDGGFDTSPPTDNNNNKVCILLLLCVCKHSQTFFIIIESVQNDLLRSQCSRHRKHTRLNRSHHNAPNDDVRRLLLHKYIYVFFKWLL
jgi:hypothetical protein